MVRYLILIGCYIHTWNKQMSNSHQHSFVYPFLQCSVTPVNKTNMGNRNSWGEATFSLLSLKMNGRLMRPPCCLSVHVCVPH
jgi:hypothetical protein